MGSTIKYWLNSGKEKRQRQNCHHRSSHYEETQYTPLQDCYDECRDGDFALRPKNKAPYCEKMLEPGDTLLSLSLQFNCPVAELKRINGILRDNEIFARRTVKVPVKPGFAATDRLAGVHGNGSRDEDKSLINFDDPTPSASNLSNKEEQTANNPPLVENSIDLLSSNTYIADILTRAVGSTSAGTKDSSFDILNNSSREDDPSSPLMLQDLPEESTESAALYRCNGADWGLTWSQLLICSLLLGFAGPVLYALYFTNKHHKVSR